MSNEHEILSSATFKPAAEPNALQAEFGQIMDQPRIQLIAAGRGPEPARPEPARPEPPRPEPPRQEPTRQEPTRQEPTRHEPTRQEPTRQEPTRQEPTHGGGDHRQGGTGGSNTDRGGHGDRNGGTVDRGGNGDRNGGNVDRGHGHRHGGIGRGGGFGDDNGGLPVDDGNSPPIVGGSDGGWSDGQPAPVHHMNKKEFMNFCHKQEDRELKEHPDKHPTQKQLDAICVNVWNKYQHHGHI